MIVRQVPRFGDPDHARHHARQLLSLAQCLPLDAAAIDLAAGYLAAVLTEAETAVRAEERAACRLHVREALGLDRDDHEE